MACLLKRQNNHYTYCIAEHDPELLILIAFTSQCARIVGICHYTLLFLPLLFFLKKKEGLYFKIIFYLWCMQGMEQGPYMPSCAGRGLQTACVSWFSPSIMWVPGDEFRTSGLARTSDDTPCAISPAFYVHSVESWLLQYQLELTKWETVLPQ